MKATPAPPAPSANTWRFGGCELDEARRALRMPGREIALQPRVFDVLRYLVRHRDRVVAKGELLDALWPGSVVVDNALQRTISLARTALAEAGVNDAVRTYSRHGYRFVVPDCVELQGDASSAPTPAPAAALDLARAACAVFDWAGACEAYARADAQGQLPPHEALAWGRAAICGGLGASVLAALERTVGTLAGAGDPVGAAQATLLLAQIRSDRKEGAEARGLLRRAERYLDGHGACAELGHWAWMSSRLALSLGDAPAAMAHAEHAYRLGRELGDADVECLGLAYRGQALMALGDYERGAELHEEAAAAVRLGGLTPWVAGWIYCSVITASRHRCDWLRAAQWTQAFLDWCRASRMPAFPGTCQVHRAEVLSVRGELDLAAAELTQAAEQLAQVAPWAEGDAYRVLGDVRLTCGDLDGAEAAFRRAHALGWEPQPGLARLQMAQGQPQQALRGLERALADANWMLCEQRAQLLCTLAEAALAVGEVGRAREALQVLEADPRLLATEALQAQGCRARAELAWFEQRPVDAIHALRQAVRQWHAVGSPACEADSRLRLAQCLLEDGDPAAAEMELYAVESSAVLRAAPRLRRRAEGLRQALRR
jgi:DNA-binding winged helix-turn-helix (wHTH) protein